MEFLGRCSVGLDRMEGRKQVLGKVGRPVEAVALGVVEGTGVVGIEAVLGVPLGTVVASHFLGLHLAQVGKMVADCCYHCSCYFEVLVEQPDCKLAGLS